ncbi:Pumilio domain-containing protein [Lachnellula willkommii]|uniref:Pumilio domain-containing protein n=1 Tax=Lachnellula willkommii TaxID=215461 RepID=A0A559ML99_9HELO|nr:Pumilio domain-containing protein [Lachnellula willkommii]
MAYSNSTSDRMDELRFRSQQSLDSINGLVSPPRTSRVPQSQPLHTQDGRGGLMRRFTTDSGRVPTIGSLLTQRGVPEQAVEYGPSTYHKVQLLEKKKLEYERLREQKRRFEAEMQLLDLQQRREEQELAQMQEDIGRTNNKNSNTGHQSEPTTPPEYRESTSGFPSVFSRPNRYSTSSLTSPPGLYNRPGRSGSQLTSPQSGIHQSRVMDDKLPSKSVPGSRRNSDEDEKEEAVRQDPTSHRATNALNRYSMPVTKSRNGIHNMLSDDPASTTRFLFGEEDGASSPDVKTYLQMNATDDKFPILVRRDEYPGLLSASSAALDLALSQSPGPDSHGWAAPFASRGHRSSQSQQSLPMSNIPGQTNGSASNSQSESPVSSRQYRHSLDSQYYDQDTTSPPVSSPNATPPKLHSSQSASEVPTMRSGMNGISSVNTTPNSHAQQHLHNHNASLGRIPPNAMNNRLSREMSSGETATLRDAQNGGYQSINSALQASTAPFNPTLTQSMSQAQMPAAMTSPTAQQAYSVPGQGYYNYNVPMMNMGMQNMSLGQQPMYSPQPNPYAPYGNMYPQTQARGHDSQARVIQQRRQNDGEAMNRFANLALDQIGGEIYSLCKDQHGCRYLQKKLEDRDPNQVHMIWLETNQHVIELMTDPFGNYLCQKLLEYCNDDERTVLIENASHDLVRIALNQHGTRALQKMIEFISTPGQVQTIISALRYRVVELIQDLNGNHVIQKCLNKLSPTDAQFIFDAVGTNCIDVGTHRHGCCVLQRCIDHASGEQKAWLIRQISNNAFLLVQDPFGNYVVQYILDLNEPIFTEPLVAMFAGRVGQLSKQKFSSNVIEKCLRCAQEPSKDMLIEEMLQPSELDRLLRDSFANYVIQTALDYANPAMKVRLIEAIRPYLPAIRTTPYGRRIQAKIQGNENRSGPSSGQATPNELEPTQAPIRHQRGMSNASAGSFVSPVGAYPNGYTPASGSGTNGFPGAVTRPAPQPGGTGGFPSSEQLTTNRQGSQQPFPYSYGRGNGQTGAETWL